VILNGGMCDEPLKEVAHGTIILNTAEGKSDLHLCQKCYEVTEIYMEEMGDLINEQ